MINSTTLNLVLDISEIPNAILQKYTWQEGMRKTAIQSGSCLPRFRGFN